MQLPELFRTYLLDKGSSRITAKNYVADINKFIRWFESSFGRAFEPQDLSADVIELFEKTKGSILEIGNSSQRSFERYLSSLRKFASFLHEENLIEENPFDEIINNQQSIINKSDPWSIRGFKDYLYVFGASKLTIKNYLVDIRAFTSWADGAILTPDLIESYKERLINTLNLSPKSVNRKLSAIRKYLQFAEEQGIIRGNNEFRIPPASLRTSKNNKLDTKGSDTGISLEDIGEQADHSSFIIHHSYSRFPPLRLAQRLSVPYVLLEEKVASKIANFIRNKKLAAKTLTSSIIHNSSFVKNVPKERYAPAAISLANKPWHEKLIHHARYTRPKWYKRYHTYSIVHYFHFAVLVIYASAVGFIIYTALFAEPETRLALAAPTAPPRILSFQGRLTDATDTPITTKTDIRFQIYDHLTATGSGNLLWQEVIEVTPDADGIFSELLGNGSTCAGQPLTVQQTRCAIASSVFTDNATLYLGITIEATAELTPRQQLATVAYAANSESLQGMLPITDAAVTDNVNTVLALDSSGNLTMDGATTPTFSATGGQFKLSGQPLLLTTNTGSNSNVIVDPAGLGKVDLRKPLNNNSNTGNISVGGVEINDKFGVLATESAVAAFIINNNTTGGDIFTASSSGTTRFTIGNDGTITSSIYTGQNGVLYGTQTTGVIAQATTASTSLCLVSGASAPTWATCPGGSSSIDTFWNQTSGLLFPNNSTVDLSIGGQSTSSAKFAFINVNSGTPTATISGNLSLATPTGNAPAVKLNILNNGSFDIQNSVGGNAGLTTILRVKDSGVQIGGTSNTLTGASLAVGTSNSISTDAGAAVGQSNTLTASLDAFAAGFQNTISGTGRSVAFGRSNTVSSQNSGAFGFNNTVSGNDSFAIGENLTAGTAVNTIVLGLGVSTTDRLVNNTANSLMVGFNSTVATFFVGPASGVGSFGNVGINTSSPLATFDIRGSSGTTPVATISGQTSFAALVVDNRSATGDLFTASSSGNPAFRIKNNGDIVVGSQGTGKITAGIIDPYLIENTGTIDPILTFKNASTGGADDFLFKVGSTNLIKIMEAGDIIPQQTGLDIGSSANPFDNLYSNNVIITGNGTISGFWQRNLGALAPTNISDDLLLGAIATASARFGVTGVAGGTPVATLSASTNNNGIALTASTATIQSLRNNTLTIGGDTTGNIFLVPNSGTSGLVNIGSNGTGIQITSAGAITDIDQAFVVINDDLEVAGNTIYDSGPTARIELGDNTTLTNTTTTLSGTTTLTASSLATITSAATLAFSGDITITGNDITNTTLNLGNGSAATIGTVSDDNLTLSPNGTGNLVLSSDFDSGTTIGTAITGEFPLLVRSGIGTNAVLAIDQLNANSDLFTASASGATKLTLSNGGVLSLVGGQTADVTSLGNANLTISAGGTGDLRLLSDADTDILLPYSDFTSTNSVLYSAETTGKLSRATTASTGLCLTSGASSPSWATCPGGTDTIDVFWNQTSGLLYPNNSTVDFAIGGQATTSAKFAVLNVNSGTPTASVSAGTTGGVYLTAGGKLATTARQPLTIGDTVTTGDVIINPAGNVGIGTTSPISELHVTRPLSFGATGKALAIFDQIENQDIFTASASGTPIFSITYAGGIKLGTSVGTSAQCITGGATAAWGTCGSGSTNYWNQTNGLLFPGNSTVDLAIGGTSSSAAKFVFQNVNSGTPTFKVFSSDSAQSLNLSHDGTNGNITASTGTINIGNGGGTLYVETDIINDTTNNTGYVKIADKLLVQKGESTGNALAVFDNTSTGDLLTASASGTPRFVINTNGNIQFGGGQTALSTLTKTGTTGRTFTFPDATGTICVSGDTCATSGTVGYWNQTTAGTLFPGNSTVDLLVGGTATASAEFAVTGINDGTPTATISATTNGNGLSLTASTATIQSLRNNTLTIGGNTTGIVSIPETIALEFGGRFYDQNATRTLLQAENGVFDVLNEAGSAWGTLKAATIYGGGNASGTITIDSTTNATKGNIQFFSASNTLSSTGVLTIAGALTVNGTSATFGNGSDATLQTTTDANLTLTSAGAGDIILSSDFNSGVSIGTSSNTTAPLSVTGGIGSNALAIFNQTNSGDILTASASGTTKLTLSNGGVLSLVGGQTADITSLGNANLTLSAGGTGDLRLLSDADTDILLPYSDFTSTNSVLYSAETTGKLSRATTASTNLCLVSGASAPSWATCPGGSSSIDTFWNQTSGLLFPNNSTVDFAIGGQATSSAKFAVLNINSGTVTATVAGNLVLGSDAGTTRTIGGTAQNTLQLGDSNTGDIALAPDGTTALYAQTGGNVGIGTTAPAYKFQVNQSGAGSVGIAALYNTVAAANNSSSRLDFNANRTSSGRTAVSSIEGMITDITDAAYKGALIFNTANNAGPTERVRIDYLGDVGIGTSAPISALHVTHPLSFGATGKALAIFDQIESQDILTASAAGVTKFRILNDGTLRAPALYDIDNITYFLDPAATGVSLQLAGDASASGSLVFDGSNKSIDILNGSRLDFQTSLGGDAGLTTRMTIQNNGNVGIGTINAPTNSSPWLDPRFQVFGNLGTVPVASFSGRTIAPVLFVTNEGSGDLIVASSSGKTAFRLTNGGDAASVIVGNGVGSSKLTVGNIDPLYSIDGGKYSTYAPFMIGLKEEITGKAITSYNSVERGYVYVLDFNSFTKENNLDLWVFSRITNPDISGISVLLTPNSQARTWYRKDPVSRKITFYSDRPTEISYRLTGSRFDEEIYGKTISDDWQTTGIIAPPPPDPIGNGNADGQDTFFANLNIQLRNGVYELVDSFGNAVHRVDGFSKLMAANLAAGLVEARKITTDSLTITADNVDIAGQSLRDYIAGIVNDTISNSQFLISNQFSNLNAQNIVSPLASIDEVRTNVISPLGSDTVEIAGDIKVEGDATVSGNLAAETIRANQATISGNLNARDASISGTLYADKIRANSIEGLEARIASVAAEQVLSSKYNVSSISGELDLASILNTKYLIPDTGFLDIENLSSDFGTFREGLIAFGPSTFQQATILDGLSIGTTLSIGPNSIDTLGVDLEIQPLKQGAISFLAGLVRIETDGTLKVAGNAEFAGDVKVEGKLSANIISPIADGPDRPLQFEGDISSSGSATFGKLNFNLVGQAEAVSQTEAVATGSAGFATLKRGQIELTIKNPNVTEKSLIYVTPFGDTGNKVLYLLRQTPQTKEGPAQSASEGSFTVGVSGTPTTKDIEFNWLIVN